MKIGPHTGPNELNKLYIKRINDERRKEQTKTVYTG